MSRLIAHKTDAHPSVNLPAKAGNVRAKASSAMSRRKSRKARRPGVIPGPLQTRQSFIVSRHLLGQFYNARQTLKRETRP